MRIQDHREKNAGCRLAGQASCKCGHGCAKLVATATPSTLYAAEFMLYAFHFGSEMETPVKKTNNKKQIV